MMDESQLASLFKNRAPPPSAVHLGARFLSADPATGKIVVEFTARPEFVNPAGARGARNYCRWLKI